MVALLPRDFFRGLTIGTEHPAGPLTTLSFSAWLKRRVSRKSRLATLSPY